MCMQQVAHPHTPIATTYPIWVVVVYHGCSGVHTHMTNTRITDPEILERRYPVVLHQFRLRPGGSWVQVSYHVIVSW